MGAIDDALGGLLNPGFPFRPSNRRTKQEEEKEKEAEKPRETTLLNNLEADAHF